MVLSHLVTSGHTWLYLLSVCNILFNSRVIELIFERAHVCDLVS